MKKILSNEKIQRTFSSIKIRNYRIYLIGQAISNTGTWMQTIGQSWLVLQLTNSGEALGITIALQFLPMLIIGPWGGVIADKFQKRRLLYITQSVAGILALTLAVLVVDQSVKLWMVYLLALGLGLVNAVDNPTRQTFIPEMVGTDYILNAISLNAVQVNLTRVIGPAVAAILIATLGLGALFFFNAASYVAVLIALTMMNANELHPHVPSSKKIGGQVREGLKYVKKSPIILTTLLMMAVIGTFTYEFTVSLPLLAHFTFHGDATTYAILSGALGVGSILGGIATATRKKTDLPILIRTAFLFGLTVLVFSVSPNFIVATLMTVIVGYFSINFLSIGNVILQVETTPEMRGRVMSFWAMAFLGSTPIGGPIIGWVSQKWGTRYGLVVGGAAAVIAAYWGVNMSNKSRKNLTGTV